ncbi:MAG TPA: hypothetical protein VNM90_11345, partial [Haliangium sp.]|nr:hypothetical protein [Haliangium sp.]
MDTHDAEGEPSPQTGPAAAGNAAGTGRPGPDAGSPRSAADDLPEALPEIPAGLSPGLALDLAPDIDSDIGSDIELDAGPDITIDVAADAADEDEPTRSAAPQDEDEDGDKDEDIEEVADLEEIDEIEEIDAEPTPRPAAAPPRPAAAPPRPHVPPVRASTPPPVPPRAAAPPIPPSATRRMPTEGSGLLAIPRRMPSLDSGSLGVPVDSGKVDLLGDQSGPVSMSGSGPVTAVSLEIPARLEIASPSALDQAQAEARDRRAPWAARERELVARFESAPDLPTAAVLAHELGELRERHLGDVDGALAAHRQALDADPSLRANLWALHRLLLRGGQWEELIDVLDAAALAAAQDQERAQLHLEKAHVIEVRLGDPARARDAYEQAAAFDPSLIEAHRGLERLALAAGDQETLARALAGLAAAMDEPAHALIYLLDLARLAGERGDFAGAREVLDRAAALDVGSGTTGGPDRVRVARERLRLAELADDAEEIIVALEAEIQALAQAQDQPRADADPAASTSGDDGAVRAVEIAALRRQQAMVARDRLTDPERAWGYLQDALGRAPAEPVILADVADLAERVGRYEELAALFQGLEALAGAGPRSPALTLRRADALLRSGHRGEARTLLDALARELPGYLPVLALRERDALQHRDWAALARAHLEVGMHPGRLLGADGAADERDRATAAAASTCAGHVLSWLCNDPAAAEAAFTQALAQVPGYGPAVEALLALHEHAGRLVEVASLLEQHVTTGSEAERTHRLERLARIYRELGQVEGVLGAEQRLLALAPPGSARAPLLWRIEGTLAALGRTRERIDVLIELAEALDVPAQRAQALGMAARACEALVDTVITDGHGQNGGAPGGELAAGDAEERRAHAARAADLYRQVLDLQPGDRYAQAALVELLRRSERWQELCAARRAEAEHLADGSALARALREAAAILRDELGQPAEAAVVYRELLDRMPGHAGAMQELAQVLGQSGEIDELVDALELESVTADAPRAQVLATLRLGLALERVSRRDQAAAAYRRVLDMAPDAAVAATLELGLAPALAAAAVIELADPVTEGSARVEALERLAESAGQTALGSELLEDAGWRWLIEADAVERAQDAFERAERWASGSGGPDNPGALLGLALLHARHGDTGAAGAALERLADAVPTP